MTELKILGELSFLHIRAFRRLNKDGFERGTVPF